LTAILPCSEEVGRLSGVLPIPLERF
jgi:Response regulator receiver domain